MSAAELPANGKVQFLLYKGYIKCVRVYLGVHNM